MFSKNKFNIADTVFWTETIKDAVDDSIYHFHIKTGKVIASDRNNCTIQIKNGDIETKDNCKLFGLISQLKNYHGIKLNKNERIEDTFSKY